MIWENCGTQCSNFVLLGNKRPPPPHRGLCSIVELFNKSGLLFFVEKYGYEKPEGWAKKGVTKH